jgi:asparagine synthase (glutamine-hydrolysing)
MQHGRNKYLLREAMKGILPETVRQRRDKYGFPIPEVRWLYGDLRPEVEALLSSRPFVERGQFDAPALLNQYRREAELWRSGKADLWDRRSRWFRILSLELWQRGLSRHSPTAADERQTRELPAAGAVTGVAR